MALGSSTERINVASIGSAIPTPKPICWNIESCPLANPANAATMISAAPVMILAVVDIPKATACLVSGSRSWRSLILLSRSIW